MPTTTENIPGKTLSGTAKIISWNMQGATNIDIAKQYLGIHRPAILALQETRITLDNINKFHHKDYKTITTNNDLATFIRKDIKTEQIQHPDLPFACNIIKIYGENTTIHLANAYSRDNFLHCRDLNTIFDTYQNLLLVGKP